MYTCFSIRCPRHQRARHLDRVSLINVMMRGNNFNGRNEVEGIGGGVMDMSVRQ